MIWNNEQETLSPEQIKSQQLRGLHNTIALVYKNVPFYKERLDKAGITPKDITGLDVLSKIPFTVKDDLRLNYPYQLFAQPLKNIVRIHGSSGTTGKPTIVGYTHNDMDVWSECMARIIMAGGVTSSDIAQIAFGYGMFTGAFGLHQGMEKIGAMVIPMSSGNTEKQLMLMKDLGTTVLISTPSYALYMSEVAQEMGIKKGDLKLKLALLGGEGHTNEMRIALEDRLGIMATENYGLSEIIGPGVSGECHLKCGLHIAEDHFIPEIINPETGDVLPIGETGELVLTTITKEGFPLLRYRTKDITYLIPEKCQCGRTSMRMAKVQGRSDDMLIIKGVNVFPSQVESVIMGIEHIGPHYQLVVTRDGFIDKLEVLLELTDHSLLDSFSKLEELEKTIKAKLHSVLGLDAKVRLAEPKTLERFVGKAKRVVDLR